MVTFKNKQHFMAYTTIQILILDRPWPGLPMTASSVDSEKSARMKTPLNDNCPMERLLDNRPGRRTAQVAMELAKYNIDIEALSEARFHVSGSLNDLEYTFYWSGKPNGERKKLE